MQIAQLSSGIDPLAAAPYPAMQRLQAVEPDALVEPVLQSIQVAAEPPLLYLPAMQSVHSDAPTVADHVPAGQAVHTEEYGAATAVPTEYPAVP